MPLEYTQFYYLEPPRATEKITPWLLGSFERRNWWAQIKKNGTNCVLFIAPDGKIHAMNRHGGDIKRFDISKQALQYIDNSLPRGYWHVLNGEWINDKTKDTKRILYIHDMLVFEGNYLIGSKYSVRYLALYNIFVSSRPHIERPDCYEVAEGLWIVKNVTNNFLDVFQSLCEDADEGLVLKNPDGKLGFGKVDWAIKCRKTTKNYSF